MTHHAQQHAVAVQLEAGRQRLNGDLVFPDAARGIVVFAHGSGSSRRSPRNRFVAGQLNDAGMATLLMDLLTRHEEQRDQWTGELRFDIPLLAERVEAAMRYVGEEASLRDLPLGLFGASTGAAAALVAAARRGPGVGAVVSRGGRPDLAGEALTKVQSATLLIVGGADREVLGLNEQALERLECPKKLEVVPGATHLFEEPGALGQVARLAREWFRQRLAA